MVKFQEFNALKQEAWETKTPEEFEKVLVKLREWFKQQELNDEQRTNMTKQITDMKTKKEAWFARRKSYQTKSTYIFREDEGRAFINLCDALSDYLRSLSA